MNFQNDATFRAFMDACPVPVFLKNAELRYVYANPPMLALAGRSEEELLGASVHDVFPGSARQLATSELATLADGRPRVEERTLRLNDGALHRFRDTQFRVQIGGTRLLGAFRVDITESARHQFELNQIERLSAVGRLAAGVARDYDNSLQSILAYADLLRASPDLETAVAVAEKIQDEVRFSSQLTRSLMQFVRQESDDAMTVDLNGTIDAQLAVLRRTLGRSLTIEWRPDEALPDMVVEPLKIGQILTNLCINASDALGGRGTLRISTHRVPRTQLARWVADTEQLCQPHAEHVALVVADDGPGMDGATAARALEPFFTTKDSGTGLGLSTVASIAHQYDGVVEIVTAPGQGMEVRVLLPVMAD